MDAYSTAQPVATILDMATQPGASLTQLGLCSGAASAIATTALFVWLQSTATLSYLLEITTGFMNKNTVQRPASGRQLDRRIQNSADLAT